MSNLALFCMILGIFTVLGRGPFILAPEATRKAFIQLFLASKSRLRIVGISVVAVGVLMIIVTQGHEQTAALIIKYYGWFMAIAASIFYVIFTSIARDIVKNMMEAFSPLTLRILGLLAVGVGAVLIWLGFAVF